MLKKALFAILLLAVAAAGGAYWAYQQVINYKNAPSPQNVAQLVTIPSGANYHSVTRLLVRDGVIPSSDWARWLPHIDPSVTQVKAGTFLIEPGLTVAGVFSQLVNGKQHQFSITFVEGSRFSEWRVALNKAPKLVHKTTELSEAEIAKAIGADHEKLEGLLLPETYHYVAGDTDLSILKRAHRQLEDVLDDAWGARNKSVPIETPYELLTLASIIEKETAIDSEREQVASVFVNRLHKRMRLQTDPTVIYGMGDKYDGNIRKKDLRTPTPYNTYVIFGLPPTPIAMPGKASIEAAANPDKTPYYYFVANGDGGHKFSKTLTEHNRAVRAYLKKLRNQ